MRVIIKATLLAISLIAAVAAPASASTARSGQAMAEVLIDARPCLFFRLTGVSEADPAVPGEGWFAIPVSNANYQTYASIVLSARLTGQPFSVRTDGSVSCGYATASQIGFG